MSLIKHIWFQAVHYDKKGLFWWEVRVVLRLLSFFYYIIIKLRLFLYWIGILMSRKLPAYVISVGNITVGGTGKTPFVLYLAEKLKENKVGILTRGYGAGTLGDDEDFPLPDNVIRRTSPDRFSAGKELIEKEGVKTIILDDGFQHLCLRRDKNFVLIDATNPFGKELLMPAGILREPMSSLKRADVFVLTHTDLVTAEELQMLEARLAPYGKKIVKTIHKPQHLVSISEPGKTLELEEIRNWNVWGFSGIGNPYQFHKTLNTLCAVKGTSIFPDHYYYTIKDIEAIIQKAKTEDAKAIITTEKDALRLKGMQLPSDIPVYYLKVKIEVTQGEDIIETITKMPNN